MSASDEVVHVPVFRPTSLTPTIPDANISDTSNGRISHGVHSSCPSGEPTWLNAPKASAWSARVPRLGFFTHARHSPVEVRRFPTGAPAEVGVGPGPRLTVCSDFRARRATGRAGRSLSQLTQSCSKSDSGQLAGARMTPRRNGVQFGQRAILISAWRGEARQHPESVPREWLAHIFMSALTYEAIQTKTSLESASHRVINGQASIDLGNILESFSNRKRTIRRTRPNCTLRSDCGRISINCLRNRK